MPHFCSKNFRYLILFLILFTASSGVTLGQTTPIQVEYGIFIKKIVPDFKDGKFYSEFYWWIKFTNDSTKTGWTNDDVANIEYINAHESEIGSFADEVQEIKSIGPNRYYLTGYHQGDFYFNPDYTSYPFDEQVLNITIENSLIPENELELVIDTASFVASKSSPKHYGLSKDLLDNKSINFNIDKSEITSETGVYNSNFGDPEFPSESKYSRINVSVIINRSFVPFITKLIIPLAIILFLVYFVFFIPADKIDIAAGLTVTSLLSAIAFQLSVNGDLPDIGYIIYIDKVFYSCYFLIAITMAQSLYTFYLDKTEIPEKVKLAKRIDLISRYLFPIIFVASIYLFA
jgi:hypothetical protein